MGPFSLKLQQLHLGAQQLQGRASLRTLSGVLSEPEAKDLDVGTGRAQSKHTVRTESREQGRRAKVSQGAQDWHLVPSSACLPCKGSGPTPPKVQLYPSDSVALCRKVRVP